MYFTKIAEHQKFSAEKLKKNPLFSDDKLMLMDVYCAHPGQSQHVHAHPNAAKVYVILEGTARVTVGDQVQEITSGEVAFAPRGVAHGMEVVGSKDVVALVFIAGTL